MQHFLSVGHITKFRHLAGPHEKFSFFMYTLVFSCTLGSSCMMGKIRVLARATLNGLAGPVVARGPPVALPWSNNIWVVCRELLSVEDILFCNGS